MRFQSNDLNSITILTKILGSFKRHSNGFNNINAVVVDGPRLCGCDLSDEIIDFVNL